MHTVCCCTCCFKGTPNVMYCYSAYPQQETFTMPCRNNNIKCPCKCGSTAQLKSHSHLPLRAMQKALVAKYTELEKLGQLAHDNWCQRRALQQQLNCYKLIRCCQQEENSRTDDSNNVLNYEPQITGRYKGTLKIREVDGCTCNKLENITCNGIAQQHQQNQPGVIDYPLQHDKLHTQNEVLQLDCDLAEAIQQERKTQQQLQDVRTELACLQSKIKSFWGDNVLDRCTPAKENRTKFF